MKKEKKEQLFEMQDIEGTAFRIIKQKDAEATLLLGNVGILKSENPEDLIKRVNESDTEMMVMIAQAVYKIMVQLEIEKAAIEGGGKNE